MKQLLFLLLFPCLALAQYTGNAGQKITLGEQTTADGLVFRVVASIDTVTATSKITRANKQDTSAFILLDTVTNLLWHYKTASNGWIQAGGGVSVSSFSAGTTGLTPSTATTGAVTLGGTLAVANGGTGSATTFTAGSVVFAGASGTYTQKNNSLFFNSSNNSFGVGKIPSLATLDVAGSGQFTSTLSGTDANFSGSFNANSYNIAGISNSITWTTNTLRIGQGEYWKSVELWDSANIVLKTIQGGNVGIGQISPTAVLHLKAGTATAGTAPLKFTSGVNLTNPLGGEMEFNGTNLFFTPSTTRHTVNHGLTGSATLDFPSTTTLLSADLTISVTGAADGDIVSLGVPNAAVNANTCYTAWVSAANTVTVRFNNYSSGTVNPASGSFKVFVTK